MEKRILSPWMSPPANPFSGPLMPPVAVAGHPRTSCPVVLKRTVSPLDCLSEKAPGKAHWLQGGAKGSIGCACAGGESGRNPAALVASAAAANNRDPLEVVGRDIGNPFHLTHQAARKHLFDSGQSIGPADD